MRITVDASTVLAVVLSESEKPKLIATTRGADLVSPTSLPWEIGNAFSLMFKKKRLNDKEAIEAYRAFERIPIELVAVDIEIAMKIAHDYGIYAYDAYMLVCAIECKTPLLSLDRRLCEVAATMKIKLSGGIL